MDVIVNADDLGSTPEVNDAVFNLMEKKLVTSASLLANAPFIDSACRETQRFPDSSFGVHLNATEFRPLTGSPKLSSLLDNEGDFVADRIRSVSIGSKLSEGLFEEFCAQIECLHHLGVAVDHIDSHHHVHTMPRLLPILKRVQKRFQIRKVRISKNIYGYGEHVSRILKLKKVAYNFCLSRYYRTATTQGFSSFKAFYECANSKTVNYKTVEVMVHPGNQNYVDDEIELLRSSWMETFNFPVRLISYSDLL